MKKDMSPQMKKRGEKLKKEVQDTQKKVYRSKMAMGGGIIDKFRTKTKTKKPKTEIKKGPMKAKPDNKGQKMTPDKSKKLKEGIKEKILPQKKKDRLNELRKELGMKKGGSALKPVDKEKNPGLAKLPTQVRNKMGYMKKGGQVRKFGGGKK
jgi:hypothetical protein